MLVFDYICLVNFVKIYVIIVTFKVPELFKTPSPNICHISHHKNKHHGFYHMH